MSYSIDKYEQLEQTNRLLENIEAKLNAMNVPKLNGNQSIQVSQRAQQIHPLIDNYLIQGNNTQDIQFGSKQNEQSYPKMALSTQVLQDDLLISGYDQHKSGFNQSAQSQISFANTNNVFSTNGRQWNIQDNNNQRTTVNAYQSTEQINNLLLGEAESQAIDNEIKYSNQNSERNQVNSIQSSNSQKKQIIIQKNRIKQIKIIEYSLKSMYSEQTYYLCNKLDDVKQMNIETLDNKNSQRSNISFNDQQKSKKQYVGSGKKDQLIKIEENKCYEEDDIQFSPFMQQKLEHEMQTQRSPLSLNYTKSFNNSQQNVLLSLQRDALKNNSQLEDELNTLRNRLYQMNHSYSKLAMQQTVSDYEVQNSQRKIYSLAQQMKDIAESLQNINHLEQTQNQQTLNSGYRFPNELSSNRQLSSGKKVSKLSTDTYEDNIIDDKVVLLEKENRRLKKENQMLKDEIEDYKDKMNKLFRDHSNTRSSLEKHIELKYETQILNMKEAQKYNLSQFIPNFQNILQQKKKQIVKPSNPVNYKNLKKILINEKDNKIQMLLRKLEDAKVEKELVKKELFNFRQQQASQNINTNSGQNNFQSSFENKLDQQHFFIKKNANKKLKKNQQDSHNLSHVESSILSQNYGESNSIIDQKRYQASKQENLKPKLQAEPISKTYTLNDYIKTEIDKNLLQNSKLDGTNNKQKMKQSSSQIKTERLNSKEKLQHTQKPPKMKKGTQENINNNQKYNRNKSPINQNEQMHQHIKQSNSLNKIKSIQRTESSLQNSRKDTHPSINHSKQIQSNKLKKSSPKRSKSTISHRVSVKF